jgi:predicted esterase
MEFQHYFQPGSDKEHALLVLHGTGGNEHDLIPIAENIGNDTPLLSPRGQVLENGMPRFFRRLSEGVFDQADLIRRTHELADFVTYAKSHYGLTLHKLYACGYSNGANIASSLLLLRPEILSGAILFRGMVPFVPDVYPDLHGKKILLVSGSFDPYATPEQTQQLKAIFEKCGASVQIAEHKFGHNLDHEDIALAQSWFRAL